MATALNEVVLRSSSAGGRIGAVLVGEARMAHHPGLFILKHGWLKP
jgi:hypothetical protein